MYKNDFIIKLRDIINQKEDLSESFNRYMEGFICDDNEANFIFVINTLNNKLYGYSYTKNPYSTLDKIKVNKEDLEQIANLINKDELKAKIFDYLWIKYKDYRSCQNAYKLYNIIVNNSNIDLDIKVHYILRMFSITISTGKHDDKLTEIKQIVEQYIKDNIKDKTFKSYCLINMFVEEKIYDFDLLLKLINMKLSIYTDTEYSQIGEKYFILAEHIICLKYNCDFNKKSNNQKVIEIRRKQIEYLGIILENSRIYLKIEYYKKIIKMLKKIPETENERAGIIRKMEYIQSQLPGNMHEISDSLDITKEVNKIIEVFRGKNIIDVLYLYSVYIKFINKDKLIRDIKDRASTLNISSLFTSNIVDKNGKVKCVIPSIYPDCDKKSIEVNAENEYLFYADLCSQIYILPILNYINDNYDITEELLYKIVDNNIFIPEKRKRIVVKGLIAGFEFDFITAINLLVPQIENAIRCLANDLGDTIYTINDEGVEELRTLNSILDSPILNEYMDEDFIFNLKSIFTSKYGINLRNDIAHGVLDDNEYNSTYIVYSWGFIFKLCCIYSPWVMLREVKNT